jgi:SSS family solute:Na+ symporter
MYWRRATTAGAWMTVGFCALVFFILPFLVPSLLPGLTTDTKYLTMNEVIVSRSTREAAPSDVARRRAQVALWEQRSAAANEAEGDPAAALAALGERPTELQLGERFTETTTSGGKAVFWVGGVHPVDAEGNRLDSVKRQPVGPPVRIDERTEQVQMTYSEDVRLAGFGNFQLDFLPYQWFGMDLAGASSAWLATLELPPKIFAPFLVMILCSLLTRRNSKQGLDRYYAKMKTPVSPDPDEDRERLEAAYAEPEKLESGKLFPGSDFEFQRPNRVDIIGFSVSVLACFGIIGLAVLIARIGAP